MCNATLRQKLYESKNVKYTDRLIKCKLKLLDLRRLHNDFIC